MSQHNVMWALVPRPEQLLPLPNKLMEHTHHSYVYNTAEGRGLMGNGNYSVTFVPLIAVMATMVPRFLSRIKQMRPTQTVTGRDYPNVREARYYFKEAIDSYFCSDINSEEHKVVPKYPDIFYSCNIKNYLGTCNHIKTKREVNRETERYLVGKISGGNSCVYIKLYRCPTNHEFHSPYYCVLKAKASPNLQEKEKLPPEITQSETTLS